jgi:hypothetical protein
MDAVKRGRGRPRGGVFGALRAKLAAMSPGETATVAIDDLTPKARVSAGNCVSAIAALARKDMGAGSAS